MNRRCVSIVLFLQTMLLLGQVSLWPAHYRNFPYCFGVKETAPTLEGF